MDKFGRKPVRGKTNPGYMIAGIAAAALVVLVLVFGFASAERVQAGSGCVVLRNGQRVGLQGPGLHWRIPGIHKYECYQTRVQNLELGGDEASRANYRDGDVVLKSKDGVTIHVSAMVYFRLPQDGLGELYDHYGRSQDEVVGRHVQPDTRNEIRSVIEQLNVDDVYLGGMDATSRDIENQLRDRLEAKGITLESFALTTVDPSEDYKSNIQNQVEQQQAAQLEQERVKVAEQQAEQKRVTAQGDADAKVIEARGEAEANGILAESLTPEVLQAMYYDTLKTINWAIFPSDTQPIMPMPDMTEATPES